jgi:transposase-like protein
MSALPYKYCAGLAAKSLVVVAACAFAVGTGGYSTAEYFIARGTKGYAYAAEEPKVVAEPVNAIARSADADVLPQHTRDIRDIKEFLKPSVAEIAKAFGVERQTIYDWQAGKGASADRRAALRELASACSKLAAMNIAAGSDILRRKLFGGKSLIQMVATGTSATAAVAIIETILDTEDREKRVLSAHLGGRSHGTIDMSDAGKPHISEEG